MQPNDGTVHSCHGIDNGLIPIVAYNYGARKPERIQSAWKWAMLYSGMFFVPFLLALELFPDAVLRLFNASVYMMGIGIPAVRILALAWMISIPGLVISSALQGLSLPNPGMLLTTLRQVALPVLLAALLRFTGNLPMIWISFVLAEIICLPLARTLWTMHWKKLSSELYDNV